ncbi:MAG: membrane protein insertase YidC [Phycisphaerae bacterium]
MSNDTRRLIIAMVLMAMVLFLWYPAATFVLELLGYRLPVPQAVQEDTTDPTDPTTQPTDGVAMQTSPPGSTQPSTTDPALQPGMTQQPGVAPGQTPGVAARGLRVVEPAEEVTQTLLGSVERADGDAEAVYNLGLALTNVGAGIESIVLNEFKATQDTEAPYTFEMPYEGEADRTRPMSTLGVTVNGEVLDLAGAKWLPLGGDRADANAPAAGGTPGQQMWYALTLADDAGPVLRLRKRYEVLPEAVPLPEGADEATRLAARRVALKGGYIVSLGYTLENLTDRPLEVVIRQAGPTTPPREIERGVDRMVFGGYWDGPPDTRDGRMELNYFDVTTFSPGNPDRDLTTYDQKPLAWFGASTVYFNAIVRPEPREARAAAEWLGSVSAVALNPDSAPDLRRVAIEFSTTPLSIAPGERATTNYELFFGPKRRGLLKNDFYDAWPRGYAITNVPPGGCTFCTFDWLVGLLNLILQGWYFIFRDWGLAIVGLVALVRLLLHPITKKSQISMLKMGKMGPEMERLKKKYGDNKEELNKAMMQMYREQGATPVLGCLPMFLQMPIWIALYTSLQATFELRQAPFLYGITWIDDLSKPDHLIEFTNSFSIFGLPITGLNLLPLLLSVVFFIQMKIQPRPTSMTPQQEQQQKIMMYMMPLLFPVFLYPAPSGLLIYILTSTVTGIVESKYVRKHYKEIEAAEEEKKRLAEKESRDVKRTGRTNEPAKPAGCLGGWMANLQQRAEEMQREAERRKSQKPR